MWVCVVTGVRMWVWVWLYVHVHGCVHPCVLGSTRGKVWGMYLHALCPLTVGCRVLQKADIDEVVLDGFGDPEGGPVMVEGRGGSEGEVRVGQ